MRPFFSRRLFAVTMVLFLAALALPDARAESITITNYPVSDRGGGFDGLRPNPPSVRDGLFDTFFWDNENLEILDTTTTLASGELRAALEFPAPVIPLLRGPITSARLQLVLPYAYVDYPEVVTKVQVHGYVGNGVVELADLSADNLLDTVTLPPWEQREHYAHYDSDSPGWPLAISFDVTGFINSIHGIQAAHAGFALRSNIGAGLSFASREFDIAAYWPRLEVTYTPYSVPEPSGAVLAALAAAVALGWRLARRRNGVRHAGDFSARRATIA